MKQQILKLENCYFVPPGCQALCLPLLLLLLAVWLMARSVLIAFSPLPSPRQAARLEIFSSSPRQPLCNASAFIGYSGGCSPALSATKFHKACFVFNCLVLC